MLHIHSPTVPESEDGSSFAATIVSNVGWNLLIWLVVRLLLLLFYLLVFVNVACIRAAHANQTQADDDPLEHEKQDGQQYSKKK